MKMVLSAGIEPAAHGLGRLSRPSGERWQMVEVSNPWRVSAVTLAFEAS